MRLSSWIPLAPLAACVVLAACGGPASEPGNVPGTAAADTAANPVAPATSAPTSREQQVTYHCGDQQVQATFRGQDSATVVVGDRSFAMSLQPAASGAKYGDGQGNELWTKGEDEALLQLAGEPARTCGTDEQGAQGRAPEATAAQPFTARGNEPGWIARIGPEPAAALDIEMDYGERRLTVSQPSKGPDGWSGTAGDGTQVKLSWKESACQDDMSGQEFAVTVMLSVGARQLHGCGFFGATPPEVG